MSCTVTFKIGKNEIVIEGVDQNSLNTFDSLYQLLENNRQLETLKTYIKSEHLITKNPYSSKEIEGLQEGKQFYFPNMTFQDYAKMINMSSDDQKEIQDIMGDFSILYVDNLQIDGAEAPPVLFMRDASGKAIYIVNKSSNKNDRFTRFLSKIKAIKKGIIPSDFKTYLYELIDNDPAWLRTFSSYTITKSTSKKAQKQFTDNLEENIDNIAREILERWLYTPEKFYAYHTSGVTADYNKNIKHIQQITKALAELRDIDPPREYGTAFANAIMAGAFNSTYNGISYKTITLDQLKLRTKQASPIVYHEVFSKEAKSRTIQQQIRYIFENLFYKDAEGNSNPYTKNIDIAAVQGEKIYFNIPVITFANSGAPNITSVDNAPEQVESYRGYNIYKLNMSDGKTRYTALQGMYSINNYGRKYSDLDDLKADIDLSYEEDPVRKDLFTGIYTRKGNSGVLFKINTTRSNITPGKVIKAIKQTYSYDDDKKVTIGERFSNISSFSTTELLSAMKTELADNILNQLDSREKVLLAAIKYYKGESINQEFIDSLQEVEYYYVANVKKLQGNKSELTLCKIPSVKSSYTEAKPVFSNFQRLSALANIIQNRFGVTTQVLTSQTIKALYKDTYGSNISEQKAFLVGDTIVINGELATNSDMIHEYMHVFMGIVKNNPDLRNDYEKFLEQLVQTKQGQAQARKYQNVEEYKGLSQMDFYEEIVANIMGQYLSTNNTTGYDDVFDKFRKFLQDNTLKQDISESLFNFTDEYMPKIPKLDVTNTATTNKISGYIKALKLNDMIKEECK